MLTSFMYKLRVRSCYLRAVTIDENVIARRRQRVYRRQETNELLVLP
jgi:hypothetical protein